MKKITLKIDGKEQTLMKGSVVEIVYKRPQHLDVEKYVGYLTGHHTIPDGDVTAKVIRLDMHQEQGKYWDCFREDFIKSINELK